MDPDKPERACGRPSVALVFMKERRERIIAKPCKRHLETVTLGLEKLGGLRFYRVEGIE